LPLGEDFIKAAEYAKKAEEDDLVAAFKGDTAKVKRFKQLNRDADMGGPKADNAIRELQKMREEIDDNHPDLDIEDADSLRQLGRTFNELETSWGINDFYEAVEPYLIDLPAKSQLEYLGSDFTKWPQHNINALLVLRKLQQISAGGDYEFPYVIEKIVDQYGKRFNDPEDAEFMKNSIMELFKYDQS
jgi:hypothetical protein